MRYGKSDIEEDTFQLYDVLLLLRGPCSLPEHVLAPTPKDKGGKQLCWDFSTHAGCPHAAAVSSSTSRSSLA